MTRDKQAAGSRQQAAQPAANRAAMLTPPGAAAIAVVRLSGDAVGDFLLRHFSAKPAEHRCVHGTLRDGDRVIDDPVVVLSGCGRVADINLHGGEWVIRECMELAQRNGFAIVDDLPDGDAGIIEQEMLMTLPLARTELAIRMLLAQPQAWARFQDDLPSSAKPDLQVRVTSICSDLSLWWMLNPPKIAIVGIANVGKSTLANQIFGQERSITADVPGTTRDWVGDWTSIDGLPVLLLDTPGMRDSSDAIEQAAIGRSAREIEQADLVIVVMDPTQSIEPQRMILERFPEAIGVVNKADLPRKWTMPDAQILQTVAVSGGGVNELRRRIRLRFISADAFENSPLWWTDRQRDLLERAADDPSALDQLLG